MQIWQTMESWGAQGVAQDAWDHEGALKIDRSRFSVARLGNPDDALAYWLSLSVQKRIESLVHLRRTLYGYTGAARGFREFLKLLNLNNVEYPLIGG